MRIDLFEFIDSVFRGIVFFFYNLVETLVTVIAQPRRGPYRLHVAHMRKGKQQISGLTFLFLFYLALFGLDPLLRTAGEKGVAGLIARTPRLDSDAVWVPVLCAMASTVVIDATLRLILRLRFRERPRKQRMLLAVAEFSAVAPIALMVATPALADALSGPVPDEWIPVLLALAMVPAFVACHGPTAVVLRPRRTRPRPRPLRPELRILAQIGMFALLGIATLAGLTIETLIIHDRIEHNIRDRMAAHEPVTALRLRCTLAGPDPHADLVLLNRGEKPVALDPGRDVAIQFIAGESGHGRIEQSFALRGTTDLPLLALPAGGAQSLRLAIAVPPGWPPSPDGRCVAAVEPRD